MKSTKAFQDTIKSYLDERASVDALFAESYAKPGKSIEECCNYILNEVQRSGCCGFADEEIYGMAVHYYDEDNLGDIKAVKCTVVVNHKVELTEEDKAKAKADAIEAFKQEEIRKLKEKEKKEKERVEKKRQEALKKEEEMPSLF